MSFVGSRWLTFLEIHFHNGFNHFKCIMMNVDIKNLNRSSLRKNMRFGSSFIISKKSWYHLQVTPHISHLSDKHVYVYNTICLFRIHPLNLSYSVFWYQSLTLFPFFNLSPSSDIFLLSNLSHLLWIHIEHDKQNLSLNNEIQKEIRTLQ